MIVQPVSISEVRFSLKRHRDRGLDVSDRLLKEIEKPGEMSTITLESDDEFLRLVWQSDDHTRALAPIGEPRTLFDCASRLSPLGFRGLVHSGHTWFKKCIEIDDAFEYSKLGLIAVTPLLDAERLETPSGTYYVYEGEHRSIVLGKRLLTQQFKYKPLKMLLLTPRRY